MWCEEASGGRGGRCILCDAQRRRAGAGAGRGAYAAVFHHGSCAAFWQVEPQTPRLVTEYVPLPFLSFCRSIIQHARRACTGQHRAFDSRLRGAPPGVAMAAASVTSPRWRAIKPRPNPLVRSRHAWLPTASEACRAEQQRCRGSGAEAAAHDCVQRSPAAQPHQNVLELVREMVGCGRGVAHRRDGVPDAADADGTLGVFALEALGDLAVNDGAVARVVALVGQERVAGGARGHGQARGSEKRAAVGNHPESSVQTFLERGQGVGQVGGRGIEFEDGRSYAYR